MQVHRRAATTYILAKCVTRLEESGGLAEITDLLLKAIRRAKRTRRGCTATPVGSSLPGLFPDHTRPSSLASSTTQHALELDTATFNVVTSACERGSAWTQEGWRVGKGFEALQHDERESARSGHNYFQCCDQLREKLGQCMKTLQCITMMEQCKMALSSIFLNTAISACARVL